MPTPFMHLQMADRIRAHADLDPAVRHRLLTHWPAFCFGNIAADFQAICDVPRQTSHFYPIPPAADDYDAFGRMLAAYPRLDPRTASDPEQTVFIAGYGTHLLYDLVWDHTVLTPNFRHADWADVRGRFTAHNTLLAYLDRDAQPQLSADDHGRFSTLPTAGRLPFAPADDLARWRNLIGEQLQPGAAIQTVAIYAQRLRMTAQQFTVQLEDSVWMDSQVFQHASLEMVAAAMDTALARSIDLLHAYLDYAE